MWELFGGSLIYSVAKDAWAAIRGRRRRLSSKRVLELRQKWKKEIDPTLWKRSQQKLGLDAIIRDMKRLDQYPEDTKANRKGISAWFKVGLSSTYHNGIEVNLGWHGLVKDANGWRLLDYEAGEKEGKTVALIATIPYERIESIDWCPATISMGRARSTATSRVRAACRMTTASTPHMSKARADLSSASRSPRTTK
jgi:hypothetical protein